VVIGTFNIYSFLNFNKEIIKKIKIFYRFHNSFPNKIIIQKKLNYKVFKYFLLSFNYLINLKCFMLLIN
jgi:hypothetical protein